MRVVNVKDVNEAYKEMMDSALNEKKDWRIITPRDGKETLEYRTPVTTVYRNPRRRVLFNPTRDANPFFHVMESLWILAGRDDVAWIQNFNSQIAQFSDDGTKFNGAYGYRLIQYCRFGQIKAAIQLLIEEPDTRRCVLSMWQPEDLIFGKGKKDIPCNTHIYLKIRDGKLNMTVCCRSNDMIWGAYGANSVHFSFLQEYIAASVDVGIGTYTQISDSFHIYTDNPTWKKQQSYFESGNRVTNYDLYDRISVENIVPFVQDPAAFDGELAMFFNDEECFNYTYWEPFFDGVALPMRRAWESWLEEDVTMALVHVNSIKSEDWRIACGQWFGRRK